LSRQTLFWLALFLKRRGRQWVWTINHPVLADDIPTFAHHLSTSIDTLCRLSGAKTVDIVGHSMGGVVAGWSAKHLDPHHRIRRIVTLGTPWKGTRVHILGFGKQCHALAPDSPVIKAIAEPTTQVTSIWSPQDAIVLPSENTIIPGISSVEIPNVGHMGMLLHGGVFRAVFQALQTGEE
jgi:pimeloyl-ACP methyl ester carboxylesterase